MTAREMLEVNAIERDRVRALVVHNEISRGRAIELRRERLRTLRTLLLLRHEAKTLRAARGEEPEPNRAWYVRTVSRVTWAMDGGNGNAAQ